VLTKKLAAERYTDPMSALRQQNHELLESLEELRRRQAEAEDLTHELADTNRGVVALYAELDTRAEQLRQASETKSRFLSNVSHELRTPLNSMLALSGLLLDGVDGELNFEQRRQIGYMRKSAQELLDLVNDLLDLAKVEAGRIDVKDAAFSVDELFGALRSTLKPLRHDAEVQLIFESAQGLPTLYSDERKISQVLRNFISNALKFTERGEVHVSAHYDSRQRRITFAVSDTGIGIAKENQERVFEEFFQVDGPLQRKAKGTGLGLPLSRKLAEILGGEVWVESEPGRGSTFFLSLPASPALPSDAAPGEHAHDRKRVLIIDDDETFRYVLRQILREQRYEVLESSDGEQGLRSLRNDRPDAVMLDLQMPTVDGFEFLRQLREDPDAERVPVIVSTSLHVNDALLSRLPAGTPVLPKANLSRDAVRRLLDEIFS
jgi:signal transduction histidine kinase/CheY-like chemotaxis protein